MHLPPYSTFPELATESVHLRQVKTTDLADTLTISFYDARPATNMAQASAMLHKINEDYALGQCIHWGIADVQTGCIVGTVGFYRGFGAGTGELGCVLKPAFRGRGLMQAAMQLAIDFGLETIGLQTIIARTDPQNTPAIKLLERLNFQLTGSGVGGEIQYSLP